MDIRTLQYWHKLEHFYPYVIGEQTSHNIKTFTIKSPDDFEKLIYASLPLGKTVRYYAVYLGIFQVDKALEALEQGMGRKMRFRDSGDDTSCFCTFTLTADREFNTDSFKISSFPWAIHRVRDGKIIIDHWDEDFHSFETDAFLQLHDHGEAFDYDFMHRVKNWFADRMNWKIQYTDHWLRIDRVVGDAPGESNLTDEINDDSDPAAEVGEIRPSKDSQSEDMDTDEQVKQNDLLNSFYIRDLERIIDTIKEDVRAGSKCFHQYMEHTSDKHVDIEHSSDVLLDLLSPEYLPKGKWPSEHGLRLMQQVDVNAFLCKNPTYHQPLFSVNGPPGTGKTTLLKDIIASIVVERAIQMCKLDMPDDAFGKIVCEIETKTTKGSFTNHLRDVNSVLKQYGILVASNNNGAVENVTHTLPSLSEIADGYVSDAQHYFSEVSDLLFGKGKTWALNAAALGNKRNRQRFIDAFWPIAPEHDGFDLNRVLREKVKNPVEADWNKAKRSFQTVLKAVDEEYCAIEEVYKQLKYLFMARKEVNELKADIWRKEEELTSLKAKLEYQRKTVEALDRQREHLCTKLDDIKKSQPLLWLKRLFTPNAPLVQAYKTIQVDLQDRILELHEARDAQHLKEQLIRDIQINLRGQQKHLIRLKDEILDFEKQLEAFKKLTGSSLRFDAYFEDDMSEEAELSSPWGYAALNQYRAKLFVEAMSLHKAFVENSKYLRDNLDAFSKMMRGNIPTKQLPIAAPVLLQSFMLAVPVVSTTFASVGTFLRYIPQREIAYLFIDEAGQAMPQSAVGAIWRARSVIAVGDPLQIEPVVTLHDSVIQTLAEYYHQNDIIADKCTSIQSLADMANRLGGYRNMAENDLWVGAPLVVHNRCQRRVFNISNKIAYNDKMIYATPDREQAQCQWIHVRGNSQNGHYVPTQADAIRELVLKSFIAFAENQDDTKKYPSLFIISPFRSVRAGIAAYFRKNLSDMLKQHNTVVSQDILRQWIRSCIGTIHTFQGKEADTVILCLGVDSSGKSMGAVKWACERPNILNVAVTRSKGNLYIVGDQTIWGNKPFFKTALEICNYQ